MTELIWDGKYKDGRKVAPVRIPLPFQTIETVNESAADRLRTLDFFALGKQTDWRNRLIWGDKKYVLPSLLPDFAGKVNLIYIDPPFDTGQDFSFTATVPEYTETENDGVTEFLKQPSVLEQKAYRDTWGRGFDSYLQWFYDTASFLYELLDERGALFVHVGPNINHSVRCILDEIFGPDKHVNEIIWRRTDAHSEVKGFGRVHDCILFYVKGLDYTWNQLYKPYDPEYVEKQFRYHDSNGRRWLSVTPTGAGATPNDYRWQGQLPPKGRHWAYSKDKMEEFERQGRLAYTSKGSVRIKQYLDEMQGQQIMDVWEGLRKVHHLARERVDYPTQKPEVLLERIVSAGSNEGDLVLDCFVGSGTSAVVAEKLNRRWIGCHLGRYAIHTTRKRLLDIPNLKPFVVQNLGKYERQAWQASEFPNSQDRPAQARAYRKFILDLYHATPIAGYTWLHGLKAKRMVHVGGVDSPVALGDVKSTIQEFWQTVGKSGTAHTNGIDVLGWEFAFDINETARQQAAAGKIDIRFKKIPREALERRAVEQGDIHFFELAGLDAKVKVRGSLVAVSLEEFVIPPDDVPEEIRFQIKHWAQWIDYWAVDWNYRDDTFHNEWQSYRTKEEPKLKLIVEHTYEDKGRFVLLVKVIDILGNDTTKALTVEVG